MRGPVLPRKEKDVPEMGKWYRSGGWGTTAKPHPSQFFQALSMVRIRQEGKDFQCKFGSEVKIIRAVERWTSAISFYLGKMARWS